MQSTTPADEQDPDSSTQHARGERYSSDRIVRLVTASAENSVPVWDRIFQSTSNGIPDQILTEAVAVLHEQEHYDAAVEGLLSAIRNGYPAPWMYDVLAAEMKLAGRPADEIARVISSRVDLAASDVSQLLLAVAMLSRFEAWDQANALAADAAQLDPLQCDVWLLGRSVADKSGNDTHRVRTRCGILKHVWTEDYVAQHDEALVTLESIVRRLEQAGKPDEAADVRRQRDEATAVDLQIFLRWVGAADLDLTVTEPDGETCSFKNRVTNGGGRLVREASAAATNQRGTATRSEEHYVCHTARSGRYDAVVRFVLGKVVAGTAVIEVVQHAGTPAESRSTQTITLSKEDVRVSIELENGRAELK